MKQENSFKISINARARVMGILNISISIIMFLLAATTFQNASSGNASGPIFVSWLIIFVTFIAFICMCIATYIVLLPKHIEIDKRGVREYWGKKISNDFKWEDITLIEYYPVDSDLIYLIIRTEDSQIRLNNSLFDDKKAGIQTVFKEISKFKPEYRFIIENKVGTK
jgi:hypothetical protein